MSFKRLLTIGVSLCLLVAATACQEKAEPSSAAPSATDPTSTSTPSGLQSIGTVERVSIDITEEMKANMSVYFQPVVDKGTVINQGQTPSGIGIAVDTTTTYQTIEGFGGSGCWWACTSNFWNEENLDEALTLLYSPEYGLGLTTYRHNIGGGTPEGTALKTATKCVEISPGVYDLTEDGPGIEVLYKIQSLGVDYFTLFMNSPPARMTKNGDTRGDIDGKSNLKEDCYEEYAKFCADIVELYEAAGIPVKYLSPINEPQWSWGKEDSGQGHYQEGCYYLHDEVLELDRLVAVELTQRGLDTKLSVPETAAWYDNSYSRMLVNYIMNTPELAEHIDHIAGHSYGATAEHKKSLANYYDSIDLPWPVHQTEWSGDDMFLLSRTINEDLTLLNATLWEFWTLINPFPGGSGHLVSIDNVNKKVETHQQYFIMGNYSRFITGATRVDLTMDTQSDTLLGSAYIKDGKTIVILTNEAESEQTVSFAGLDGQVAEAHETSNEYNLQYVGDVDAAYGYTLPARSVTTFVFA